MQKKWTELPKVENRCNEKKLNGKNYLQIYDKHI